MAENQRRAFKFYKSYFDVYNELSDKDKLKFIEALLRKQFYGEEPNLKGMAHFAYLSQKHSIDKQVKGFEDKTKTKLKPIQDPMQGCLIGGLIHPKQQEQEKEQEKEQEQLSFDRFWNLYDKKIDRKKCQSKFRKLKQKDISKIFETLPKYIKSTPDKQFRKNPSTYLNNESWNDELTEKPKPKQYPMNNYKSMI